LKTCPPQVSHSKLDVRSLTGLFYMMLLAIAVGILIAATERVIPHMLAACPGITRRLHQISETGAVLRMACVPALGCRLDE